MKRSVPIIKKKFDLVVCGGGMPGICAAIQGARKGLKTALIHNRGVLGGNASPEIRVHVCGATGTSEFNLYSREGGIIGELLIENRHRNPQGNVYLWHTVLIDALEREENCSVFLNTNIDAIHMEGKRIISVEGSQCGSEKRFCLCGDIFIDDTGDGTVGYLAGADYMYGRESKAVWGEEIAPDSADRGVLLSSLPFYSKDFHRPMHYELPEFVKDEGERFRRALACRTVPDRIPNDARYDGFRFQWYYEAGSDKDQIRDNEEIVREHQKLLFHIWDYIKHGSHYDAEQFDLEYISPVLGKRESRRLIGEYILKEKDIARQTEFYDAIAYGGWSIDLHAAGGFFSDDLINKHYYLRGTYQIPFRCCCVQGIDNLMAAGRCLSVSHVALGTVRIMSTLSLIGQACGMAAFLCGKYGKNPSEIGRYYIEELQQELQLSDQGIVGLKKAESVISRARISATSFFKGKLQHTGKWRRLEVEKGFVFPVVPGKSRMKLFFKADADTFLTYQIYRPSKTENYGPDIRLAKRQIVVGDMNETSVILDFSGLEYEKKLFVVLEKNNNLSYESTDEFINGIRMFERQENAEGTYFDIATFKRKEYLWEKVGYLPVFEYESDIYAPQNLNNGYIRNYGYPNLWLSEIEDKQPEIQIEFEKALWLSGIEVTFDNLSDDFDYDTLECVYESNVWECIIKDYDVYGYEDKKWKMAASVRNNYQRKNVVYIQKGKYKKLKIKLLETNGSRRFGIYDIAVF